MEEDEVLTEEAKTQLTKLGKEMGELVSALQNALDDKKVDLGEYIEMGKEATTLIMFILSNRKELMPVIRDGLSEEEYAAFSDGFTEGYDITNDTLEDKIEVAIKKGGMLVYAILGLFYRDKDEEAPAAEAPVEEAPAAEAPVEEAPTAEAPSGASRW